MGRGVRRAVITERDLDIFRLLSSGPATFIQVRLLMERIYKRKMSDAVLWVRLSKLKAGGYVGSRRYAGRRETGRFSLYSLTLLAKEALVNAGYPAGSLRSLLPDDLSVFHEMLVTDAVRAIKREGARLYEYQLTDRAALKRASRLMEKSEQHYPDIRVRITAHAGRKQRTRIYDIEVDNHLLLPAEVIEKVKRLEYTPLVLCAEIQRVDALRKACAAFGGPDLGGKALFGLAAEFTKGGFSGTQWTNVKGEKATIL